MIIKSGSVLLEMWPDLFAEWLQLNNLSADPSQNGDHGRVVPICKMEDSQEGH